MTDLDAVDHAAEHYAMTGNTTCWCDDQPCTRCVIVHTPNGDCLCRKALEDAT